MRRGNREDGQSLVEFVFTAPVLIILLLGMAEFGHGLNSYLTVVAAARDSARMGAQQGPVGPGRTLMLNVVEHETKRLTPGGITNETCGDKQQGICITSCLTSGSCPTYTGSAVQNKNLSVRVCYDHPMIIGIPWFMEGPIPMCSTTTIRVAK